MSNFSINLLAQFVHASSIIDELDDNIYAIEQESCSPELLETINREIERRKEVLMVLVYLVFASSNGELTPTNAIGESGIFVYDEDGNITISDEPSADENFEIIEDCIVPI